MKLRYFIPAIIALFSLALTSCNDDDSATLLDEIQLTSSNVGIPVEGGSTSVGITASDTWSVDPEEIPDWLTVSPMTGQAGQTAVSFSAPAAPDARSTVLHIECRGKRQTINIIQGLPSVTVATCAEVIAGPESKTYRVTGTVTSWGSNYAKYGNFNLTDETGTIYIYGMADKQGKLANNPIASWGLELGDIITVEGPKTVYNGTVELVDVTVINIQKSLVKVESMDPANGEFPKEGGDVTVNLSCKTANGISVEIPEEAKDWLSIASITGGSEPIVKFHAAPNEGGERTATVTFKTTDGSKEYTSQAVFVQKGSVVAATVAEFLAAEVGDTQYRIQGIVSGMYEYKGSIQGFYIADYTGNTLVYKPEGFTGTEAKVGDVVTVVGKRGAYKDSPQMVSGTLESVDYAVTAISIADFRNLPDNKQAYYLISGEIVNATEENTKNDVTQYGNFNLKDETGEVYIYGVLTGWGGSKGHFGELDLTWGDKLTIIAYKTTYNGLVEGVGTYLSSEKAN